MNALIRLVYDAGYADLVYYLFHALGFIGILLFNVFYAKNYKISKKDAAILTIVTYAIAYVWVYVLAYIENQFSNWGANNIVRAFVWFPLIALIPNLFLKIDKKDLCDFIAPCCALVQAISHIGCIFAGCCQGYPMTDGLYNPVSQMTVFPSQLVECGVALAIFFLCIWMAKHFGDSVNGKIFPLFLVSFGATRFVLEFFRANRKIIGNISILALHALLMVIVGMIWLALASRKQEE